MTLTQHTQAHEDPSTPEDLIPEAREVQRQRNRRRLLMTTGIGVGVGILAAITYLLLGVLARSTAAPAGKRATVNLASSVIPKDPTTLAMGPNGVLYVADPGRQQILKRLRDGRFEVAVGTGVTGDTGDGGRATRARIDIDNASNNLVVTRSGTLYFIQSGPAHHGTTVRKVSPTGRISTMSAPRACQSTVASTGETSTGDVNAGDLATTPNGDLSMLASCSPDESGRLLELTASGRLVVAPHSSVIVHGNDENCGAGLAYSTTGTIYTSCIYGGGHPDGWLVVKPNGQTKEFPANPRIGATAAPAAIATASHGSVVGIDFLHVVRVTPQGVRTVINLSNSHAPYYKFLGKLRGIPGRMETNGITVDRHGNIYLASTSRFGNGTFTGIIELHANGRVQTLWSRASSTS